MSRASFSNSKRISNGVIGNIYWFGKVWYCMDIQRCEKTTQKKVDICPKSCIVVNVAMLLHSIGDLK